MIHEEHRIARSLKGQHVLAWRREDIYGPYKKLKWSTKCQLQCSHPGLRNGSFLEDG